MNLILFFVFLLSDLLIVLICRFSYGNQSTYKEGMLMGVHIPSDCIHDPQVQEITQKSERAWQLFQRNNLAAGILVCFLCFLDFLLFIVIWTVWLLIYIGGTYYLIIKSHRQMYRLKIQRGWVNENSRRLVRVDTAVSAASSELTVSWKWHVPVLVFVAASLLPVLAVRHTYEMAFEEELIVWILYASTVGVCILFMALHLGISAQVNRVYSENSQVNFSVNMIMKRGWTQGLVWSSWTSGAAWIFLMAAYFISGPDLSGWIYIIYAIVMALAAVVLVFPVVFSVKKKSETLESDTEPYFTDDDEYWKNGWYNNPNDRHIFVQDRLNSMNYTFNFGRPGVKKTVTILYVLTIIFIVAVVLWCVSLVTNLNHAEVTFSQQNGIFALEAAGYECEFAADEIQSVQLLDALPDDSFMRTNGGSTESVNIGYFKGNKIGKCMMFLYKEYDPILEIDLTDGTVLFANSREEGKVEQWYEMLSR